MCIFRLTELRFPPLNKKNATISLLAVVPIPAPRHHVMGSRKKQLSVDAATSCGYFCSGTCTGPELSSAAREALLPAADDDVVETNGDAGDVLLTHPLLLHSRCARHRIVSFGVT